MIWNFGPGRPQDFSDHLCHNPSKSSHAERIIGVEKGELSTAEDPGAPRQRELNEARKHPHFLFPFFASA
jgi:hypothetical protein